MSNESRARALYQRDLDHAIRTESEFRFILRVPTDGRKQGYAVHRVAWDDLPVGVRRGYERRAGYLRAWLSPSCISRK